MWQVDFAFQMSVTHAADFKIILWWAGELKLFSNKS
jgi:hypothetical protein